MRSCEIAEIIDIVQKRINLGSFARFHLTPTFIVAL